ncbi:MAG TPA: YaiO family outer membrane beta-barrel protein [Gracilimonas sp.]|uniref:YaiO family outer membrane beta-barrel protein n=1 Tax=Gracilimonas sp. TaxID=1974203 RepID=UPI002D9B81B6|nr:YaiO family outer membrane beta-barrel protein [Gracilimonas sp.]
MKHQEKHFTKQNYKEINALSGLIVVLVLMLSVQTAFGQTIENIDEAFQQARELAFDGQREEARELAYAILERSPDYHDVRILIARTYAWDGSYDKARVELNYVLEKRPDYKDALFAAIDNERWAENETAMLNYSKQAVKYHSVDKDVLLKRAESLNSAGKDKEALQVLNQLEQIDKSNAEAQQLRESIKTSRQDYTLTTGYTYDTFEDIFDDIHKGYVQLSRRTNYGSIIGRLNYQRRFSTDGLQAELDFYPSITDGWYGYVSAGYSSSSLFPEFRSGAELYKNLPRAFEVSAGFRYLRFNSDVWIFTGTVSKYQGNWLFTVRPYITPNSIGVSRSLSLLARKYLAGPENYITFRGGFGFYPEERRFQNVSGDVFFTESQFIGIDGYKELRYNLSAFLSFDLTRQELAFNPDNFINVITLNGGVVYKF